MSNTNRDIGIKTSNHPILWGWGWI